MFHAGEWLRELFNNEIKFKSIFRGNSNLVKNFERGLSKLIGFDQNDLCLTYSQFYIWSRQLIIKACKMILEMTKAFKDQEVLTAIE